MKAIDKAHTALAAFFLAGAVPATAELVAGWDTWDGGDTPTATRLAADVTATALTTLDAGDNNANWRVNDGRGASTDGDWGGVTTTPPASTLGGEGISNECLELGNATTGGTLTFSITNDGAEDLVLGSFNFDTYAFRPKAARTYELSVVEGGGITPGVLYTSGAQEITSVAGAWNNDAHDEIEHSLIELSDYTLAPGESVDFLLTFSGGAGDGSGGHDLWVDNVAVFDGESSGPPASTDVDITKIGKEVTLTFTAAGLVNIFRSTDLQDWEEISDGEVSPFVDLVEVDSPDYFYLVVPEGVAAP